jgi:hypothetical protein
VAAPTPWIGEVLAALAGPLGAGVAESSAESSTKLVDCRVSSLNSRLVGGVAVSRL